METLQIRLPEKQIREIDKEVRCGTYRSRSEAIRSALEKLTFLSQMNAFREIIEREGANKGELLTELKKVRGGLYKKYT